MSNKAKRPCKTPRCPGLTLHHSGYCEAHKAQYFTTLRTVSKEANKEKKGFYNSSAWRSIRRECLLLHPFCASCGEIANVVDHILARRFYPDKAHDMDNLQSLCTTCHNRKTGREIRARQIRHDVEL